MSLRQELAEKNNSLKEKITSKFSKSMSSRSDKNSLVRRVKNYRPHKPSYLMRRIMLPLWIRLIFPRIDVVHDLADDQKVCPHGGTALRRIDSETHGNWILSPPPCKCLIISVINMRASAVNNTWLPPPTLRKQSKRALHHQSCRPTSPHKNMSMGYHCIVKLRSLSASVSRWIAAHWRVGWRSVANWYNRWLTWFTRKFSRSLFYTWMKHRFRCWISRTKQRKATVTCGCCAARSPLHRRYYFPMSHRAAVPLLQTYGMALPVY